MAELYGDAGDLAGIEDSWLFESVNQNLEAVASIDIHASWLPSEVTGGGFYYTDLSVAP